MLTDAQLDELIRSQSDEIKADETSLERKRIKLELLRELRGKTAPASKSETTPKVNGHVPALRPYGGMAATPAILKYLKDKGGKGTFSEMLNVLASQIKSKSDSPKAIVRTCAKQLAGRKQVKIDEDNISLIESQ